MKKSLNIFLSHSSKDFTLVRKIRNMLEEVGHKPLMFHLKCLEQSGNEELFELIKREIDSREWFILCKSKNAENSEWVMREMKYVEEHPHKIPEIIHLEEDFSNLDKKIKRILENLSEKSSIFISCPLKLASFAKKVSTYLTNQEYDVFDFDKIPLGEDFANQIQDEISRINKSPKGIFIVITDKNGLSCWQEKELSLAKRIITFIIDDQANSELDTFSVDELRSDNFVFSLTRSNQNKWLKIIETAIRINNISTEIDKQEKDYTLYHQRGELYEEIGYLINAVNDYHKADNLLEENRPKNKQTYEGLKFHYFNHWDDVHHELANMNKNITK